MGMQLSFQEVQLCGNFFLLRKHPGFLFDSPTLEKFYDHWTGNRSCHAKITVGLKPFSRYKAEPYKLLHRNIYVSPITGVDERSCNPPNQDQHKELPYFSFQQKTRNCDIHQWITEKNKYRYKQEHIKKVAGKISRRSHDHPENSPDCRMKRPVNDMTPYPVPGRKNKLFIQECIYLFHKIVHDIFFSSLYGIGSSSFFNRQRRGM